MGGGAGIAKGVVEDEVLKVDKFTIDPERGAGIGKVLAFDPALPDRRTRDALVETGERDGCGF